MGKKCEMVAPYERYAGIYDRVGADEFSMKLFRLLLALLKKHDHQPRIALDLACGTGTVALAMARMGMAVTGVDLSPQMLEQARAKLARETDLTVRFIQDDMRRFVLAPVGELVTCWFDAMNYNLRDEDLLATFRSAAASLATGGLFVFDMNSITALAELWGNNVFVEEHDDVMYVWQNAYEPVTRTGTLTATWFVRRGDLYERFTEIHVERAYEMLDVKAMLEHAGFAVLEVVRTNGSPAREEDTRHIYVCRKV